uniref:Uncharacterized protein n=1 Tax=Anguilla anguilla TaxID=7936 RepID=A0A0E9UR32_ANGAN
MFLLNGLYKVQSHQGLLFYLLFLLLDKLLS